MKTHCNFWVEYTDANGKLAIYNDRTKDDRNLTFRFTLLDDDGEEVATGRMACDGWAKLDDTVCERLLRWGEQSLGATTLRYKEPDEEGQWQTY